MFDVLGRKQPFKSQALKEGVPKFKMRSDGIKGVFEEIAILCGWDFIPVAAAIGWGAFRSVDVQAVPGGRERRGRAGAPLYLLTGKFASRGASC